MNIRNKQLNPFPIRICWILFTILFMVHNAVCLAQVLSTDDSLRHELSVTKDDSDVVLSNLVFDLKDILANEYWGRNPFLPYANLRGGERIELNSVQADKNDRVFFLEQIYWIRNGKRAIINNQKLMSGDTIKGYHINYIGEKVVILKSKNDYVVLSLNE